jgi:hypothetical protein
VKLDIHVYLFSSLIPEKEEFEDTKGVIRSRKTKKQRQYNDQKKKNKSSLKITKR